MTGKMMLKLGHFVESQHVTFILPIHFSSFDLIIGFLTIWGQCLFQFQKGLAINPAGKIENVSRI